ncbi:biotin/lipoyl-containing protein [Hymenobacter sp. J193]|uniref:acetyl-CoA carboxylase biotin carboxyl carrier protein subunit n=1 Tax=Hymenobacter sp. J193 TaxID=2898429 RepID=UPI0027E325A7|nr:biotin/lipoyl-containing protein [Hymenobacter sp. J193]
MLQVTTGSDKVWEVDFRPGSITVQDQPFNWDIMPLGNERYHVVHEGRSFSVEVVQVDRPGKTVQLKINGQQMELTGKDRFDLLLDKMGLGAAATQKVNQLKAPMPGLIVDVRVEPGQTVQKGDALLVLEAMKMENILKAPADGTISDVKVRMRDNVTKGQILIQFG